MSQGSRREGNAETSCKARVYGSVRDNEEGLGNGAGVGEDEQLERRSMKILWALEPVKWAMFQLTGKSSGGFHQVDRALSEGYVYTFESEYDGRNRSCSRSLQQL